MEEAQLISRAKNGDKWALNELFKENYPLLKGYILKITGNEALAEDIVQEALLKAVININKYEPKGKYSTYLITIATNCFRDYLRKNKRLVAYETINEVDSASMEEEIIVRSNNQEILKLLGELSYEKRAVFILKHYHNYKYKEIA